MSGTNLQRTVRPCYARPTRCPVPTHRASDMQVRAAKYNKISDINTSCLDPVLEHLSYFEGKEHLREMSDALFDVRSSFLSLSPSLALALSAS
eukprot:825163-Rhodomonas_salina.1